MKHEQHASRINSPIALVLALMLSGCATTSTMRSYSGPSRPRSEVGMIRLGGGLSQNITYCKTALVSIDGQDLPKLPWRSHINQVDVLPGEHQLVFDCYFDIGINPVAGPGTVTMEEARYRLDHSLQAARIVISCRDTATKPSTISMALWDGAWPPRR